MDQASGLSVQREPTIAGFIHMLTQQGELHPKTVREYASDLKHFNEWYLDNNTLDEAHRLQIQDVKTPTLEKYRDDAHQVMLLKPATINRRIITLKRFFKWAVSEFRLSFDPSKALKFIPEDKVSPRRMTAGEEQAFLNAVQCCGSLRDQTILTLMFHTGIRTMELCDLTPNDIKLSERSAHLIVRADQRNAERKIPLNVSCIQLLNPYLSSLAIDTTYLFPSEKTSDRLTERAVRHLIQKVMTSAKLEGLSSHDLRHRYGYAMAESTPLHHLAEMMGHTNPDTTMVYVKALNVSQR